MTSRVNTAVVPDEGRIGMGHRCREGPSSSVGLLTLVVLVVTCAEAVVNRPVRGYPAQVVVVVLNRHNVVQVRPDLDHVDGLRGLLKLGQSFGACLFALEDDDEQGPSQHQY